MGRVEGYTWRAASGKESENKASDVPFFQHDSLRRNPKAMGIAITSTHPTRLRRFPSLLNPDRNRLVIQAAAGLRDLSFGHPMHSDDQYAVRFPAQFDMLL